MTVNAVKNGSVTTKATSSATSTEMLAWKLRLGHIKDELEQFGWSAYDTARYMRDALKAMHIKGVIELFEGMLAEERHYYSRHALLVDDQLDHTMIA